MARDTAGRRKAAAERAHSISSVGFDQGNKRCGHCGTGASDEKPIGQSLCPGSSKHAAEPGQGVDVLPTPTDSLQNPFFPMYDMEFEGHGPIFAEDGGSTIEGIEAGGPDDAFLEREAGGVLVPEDEASPRGSRSDVSSSDGAASPKRRPSQGCRGQLALHLAARGGFNSIINVLLNNGARLNMTDVQGRTALHYAVDGGHAETLKLLLSWGADSLVLDSDGLSCLHLAASSGHELMVRLLIAHGADPNSGRAQKQPAL